MFSGGCGRWCPERVRTRPPPPRGDLYVQLDNDEMILSVPVSKILVPRTPDEKFSPASSSFVSIIALGAVHGANFRRRL